MSTSYKRKTLAQGPIYGPKSKKSKTVSSKKISTVYSNTELFARSLANPMKQYQARIPDLSCTETATFSVEQCFDYDPVVDVVVGEGIEKRANLLMIAMGSANPMPVIYESRGKVTTGGSSDGNPMFSWDNDVTKPYVTDLSGAKKIMATYSKIRLVSCGVQVEFTGGDNENAGTINACIVNHDDLLYGNKVIGTAPDFTPDVWHTGVMGSTQDTATYNGLGINKNMILNARDNFNGPGKFGCYYSYRNSEPTTIFGAPTIQNVGGTTYTSPTAYEEMLVLWADVQDTETVKFRVKLVANFEGCVIDGTFPKPNSQPSPMDIYGLQSGVEAALATPRLGSLSEGPTYTWNNLENIGISKFRQVVALSQGR